MTETKTNQASRDAKRREEDKHLATRRVEAIPFQRSEAFVRCDKEKRREKEDERAKVMTEVRSKYHEEVVKNKGGRWASPEENGERGKARRLLSFPDKETTGRLKEKSPVLLAKDGDVLVEERKDEFSKTFGDEREREERTERGRFFNSFSRDGREVREESEVDDEVLDLGVGADGKKGTGGRGSRRGVGGGGGREDGRMGKGVLAGHSSGCRVSEGMKSR